MWLSQSACRSQGPHDRNFRMPGPPGGILLDSGGSRPYDGSQPTMAAGIPRTRAGRSEPPRPSRGASGPRAKDPSPGFRTADRAGGFPGRGVGSSGSGECLHQESWNPESHRPRPGPRRAGPIEKVDPPMPTFTLTDVSHEIWVETLTVDAAEMGLAVTSPWSVTKRRLRGGRRDGVDLIVVDNGALRFSIVPTRGMGLWKGFYEGNRAGLGLADHRRPGPPVAREPDGGRRPGLARRLRRADGPLRAGEQRRPVRGQGRSSPTARRATRPSACTAGSPTSPPRTWPCTSTPEPPHEIVVEGHVDESRLFGPQVRMVDPIHDGPRLEQADVRDEFVNLKDQPVEIQVLYHWNFGPPFLGEGSRFVAPIRSRDPARRPSAQEGIDQHDRYGGPEPGFAEQVYYYDLPRRDRRAGDRPDAGHAPQPGRRQGGRAPVPHGPAPGVHPLEEHGRPARRLRHRPGAGHELPECSAVRRRPTAGS